MGERNQAQEEIHHVVDNHSAAVHDILRHGVVERRIAVTRRLGNRSQLQAQCEPRQRGYCGQDIPEL